VRYKYPRLSTVTSGSRCITLVNPLEHSKTITLGHSTTLELEDRLIWADSDDADVFMEAAADLIGTTQELNAVGTNCALLDRMDEVLCSTAACRGWRMSSGPATPPQPTERPQRRRRRTSSGPTSSLAERTSRRCLSCTTRPCLPQHRLPLDSGQRMGMKGRD
jgi:hypothetical protein